MPTTMGSEPAGRRAAWSIRGEPELLAAAAAELRRGLTRHAFLAELPSEYIMFGLARMLQSLAYAIQDGDDIRHEVVSAATEISRHVTRYLPPMGHHDGPQS